MKFLFYVVLASALTLGGGTLRAENVATKSSQLRVDLMDYMRRIKFIALNFYCSPFPDCIKQGQGIEKDFNKEYNQIKRVYQEGMIYFFEGSYVNSYNRFLITQSRIEDVLTEMSQTYLDRTSVMLRDAIEKKNPQDPNDQNLTDVFLSYGPNAYNRRIFAKEREAPAEKRGYNPKDVHWMQNRYRIERNVRKGYEHLSLAREARLRAFRVVARQQKDAAKTKSKANQRTELASLTPTVDWKQSKKRIRYYLDSIRMCRKAKANASFIFMLKYPYDNYALQNPFGLTEKGSFTGTQKPAIQNVRMNWTENPFLLLKKLHPVFDLRVPEKYHRDMVDIREEVYSEEVERRLHLKLNINKPKSFEQLSEQKTGEQKP